MKVPHWRWPTLEFQRRVSMARQPPRHSSPVRIRAVDVPCRLVEAADLQEGLDRVLGTPMAECDRGDGVECKCLRSGTPPSTSLRSDAPSRKLDGKRHREPHKLQEVRVGELGVVIRVKSGLQVSLLAIIAPARTWIRCRLQSANGLRSALSAVWKTYASMANALGTCARVQLA